MPATSALGEVGSLARQASANDQLIFDQEWRSTWFRNTALLEGYGFVLLELQAPASASGLETAIREMATAMKNSGYNLRISVVNLDADALALGTQQMAAAGNAAERVNPELEVLCVPMP